MKDWYICWIDFEGLKRSKVEGQRYLRAENRKDYRVTGSEPL